MNKKLIIILSLVIFIFLAALISGGVYYWLNYSSTEDASTEIVESQGAIVQIGLMIHLEGWKDELGDQESFAKHAQAVREFAAILNQAGAKGTFEASLEFNRACDKWEDNVMLELAEQGHGVGVHADAGGNANEALSFKNFVSEIKIMKSDLEKLTGQEVLHVSGICSDQDWVKAASNAGYKFTTGTVGYCAMSLPRSKRPSEYMNCPNPGTCHGVIPVELENRLHPWLASTATNWLEHDPSGPLVILSGDYVLKNYIEDDEFNQQDIDAYITQLEEAISLADPNKTNFLYPALSIGSAQIDELTYQKWLEAIQPYVDSGQVEWKTLPETYKAYINPEVN